jgi:predicted metal-dependent phosphoesterase TrpH
VLKVELHSHTNDDPVDCIPYTTSRLIERAAAMGYQALAITLHDRQLDLAPFAGLATELGVTLIPGIEKTIEVEGKHVLLLNFTAGTTGVRSFDDLARLKRRRGGLVVAPHPFFPSTTCLQRKLHRYADLFDAVEFNGMFTSAINFNRRAVRWAKEHGKPIVGNGDVHRLEQLGKTYSLVEAEPDADAICDAIRSGRVRFDATPHTAMTATLLVADMFSARLRRDLLQGAPSPRTA